MSSIDRHREEDPESNNFLFGPDSVPGILIGIAVVTTATAFLILALVLIFRMMQKRGWNFYQRRPRTQHGQNSSRSRHQNKSPVNQITVNPAFVPDPTVRLSTLDVREQNRQNSTITRQERHHHHSSSAA